MRKTRIHPMWFILFTILGLVLYLYTNNEYSLIISLGIGFLLMVVIETTPSELVGFKKTPIQTIIVWIVTLSIVIILILYIFF
jgi:hypothetical protein